MPDLPVCLSACPSEKPYCLLYCLCMNWEEAVLHVEARGCMACRSGEAIFLPVEVGSEMKPHCLSYCLCRNWEEAVLPVQELGRSRIAGRSKKQLDCLRTPHDCLSRCLLGLSVAAHYLLCLLMRDADDYYLPVDA